MSSNSQILRPARPARPSVAAASAESVAADESDEFVAALRPDLAEPVDITNLSSAHTILSDTVGEDTEEKTILEGIIFVAKIQCISQIQCIRKR